MSAISLKSRGVFQLDLCPETLFLNPLARCGIVRDGSTALKTSNDVTQICCLHLTHSSSPLFHFLFH